MRYRNMYSGQDGGGKKLVQYVNLISCFLQCYLVSLNVPSRLFGIDIEVEIVTRWWGIGMYNHEESLKTRKLTQYINLISSFCSILVSLNVPSRVFDTNFRGINIYEIMKCREIYSSGWWSRRKDNLASWVLFFSVFFIVSECIKSRFWCGFWGRSSNDIMSDKEIFF